MAVRVMRTALLAAALLALLAAAPGADAVTPPALRFSHAGDINFVGTGGTFRRRADNINPCQLQANADGALSGIPAGATVVAAYLYWGGSGATADNTVTFDGNTVNAARTFTDNFVSGGTTLPFFGAFADVTAIVQARRNGTYRMQNLTVDNGGSYCAFSIVLSGWSLAVVYEDPAEDLRVINVFDGFQAFQGSAITLTPNNFVVPASPINGKVGYVTFEGDPGNSTPLGGFSEEVRVNGVTLTSPGNPAGSQFNGTVSDQVRGTLTSNVHGVDFDVYDLTASLSAGDTSAATRYSSGGDFVFLAAELVSVTNTEVADLAITKTHAGDFTAGQTHDFTLTVTNNGPSTATLVQVRDVLPAEFTYVAASGTGWTCNLVAGEVVCDHPGPVADGASLPPVTLQVTVVPGTPAGVVVNTATVTGNEFDNISANNTASDPVTVLAAPPQVMVLKSATTLSDPTGTGTPKAIPGAVLVYEVIVSNNGGAGVDAGSVVITDRLPAETELFVGDLGLPAGFVEFMDGATASGLTYDPVTDLQVSYDGGTSYVVPVTTSGFDPTVTHLRVRPGGTFNAAAPGAIPTATLRYRVRIR